MENAILCQSREGIRIRAGEAVTAHDIELVKGSALFRNWQDGIDARFHIESVTIQHVFFCGTPLTAENVGFIYMIVRENINGRIFYKVIRLCGDVSCMLPVLLCEGKPYVILVKQPRLATGNYEMVEFPAGRVEVDGTFHGTAIREMEEELGLVFSKNEITDLTALLPGNAPQEIYFSPGIMNERARFYLAERIVTSAELDELQGKATGLLEEGEHITLMVVPFVEVFRYVRDCKSLAMVGLYTTVFVRKQLDHLTKYCS